MLKLIAEDIKSVVERQHTNDFPCMQKINIIHDLQGQDDKGYEVEIVFGASEDECALLQDVIEIIPCIHKECNIFPSYVDYNKKTGEYMLCYA